MSSTTVAGALALLEAGEITPVELLAQVLERLERTEPHARAYASLDLERAQADAERRGPGGALRGIPFGLKDVFEVAGRATSCGMTRTSRAPGVRDAAVLTAARQAGALLLGLQVTHELTAGLDEPPTRSTANPEYYAGGSSVGSAVSVAAGSSLFALGTDAAGSVRIPASANGVVGLKPTRGLLSRHGIARCATAPTIDNVGILAKTVEDVSLVLEAIRPGSTLRPDESGELRIGLLETRAPDEDPAVTTALDSAVATLTAQGATIVPVGFPDLSVAPGVTGAIFTAELALGNRAAYDADPSVFDPRLAELIRAGLAMSRAEVRRAHEARRAFAAGVESVMATHRLAALLLPTMPVPPPRLSDLDPARDLPRLTALTSPFNLSGHPAISVPGAVSADGLPLGIQLVGRRFDESTLLRIARDLSPSHTHQFESWSS